MVVTAHPVLWAAIHGTQGLGPKAKWEETLVWERQGGADAGKRWFSYQRALAGALSWEHQCLWEMDRTPSAPPQPLWDPSRPWPQGEAKGLLIDTPRAVPCLQFSSWALSCPSALSPGQHPSLEELTDPGMGQKPEPAPMRAHLASPPCCANDCAGEGGAVCLPLSQAWESLWALVWSREAQGWGKTRNPAPQRGLCTPCWRLPGPVPPSLPLCS